MNIACETGKIVSIISANYGRLDRTTCPHSASPCRYDSHTLHGRAGSVLGRPRTRQPKNPKTTNHRATNQQQPNKQRKNNQTSNNEAAHPCIPNCYCNTYWMIGILDDRHPHPGCLECFSIDNFVLCRSAKKKNHCAKRQQIGKKAKNWQKGENQKIKKPYIKWSGINKMGFW